MPSLFYSANLLSDSSLFGKRLSSSCQNVYSISKNKVKSKNRYIREIFDGSISRFNFRRSIQEKSPVIKAAPKNAIG